MVRKPAKKLSSTAAEVANFSQIPAGGSDPKASLGIRRRHGACLPFQSMPNPSFNKPLNWMYPAAVFVVLFALSAGRPLPIAAQTAISVDPSTQDFLKIAFEETKACSQLDRGTFEEITITFMPPTFPCPHYAEGCNGEYVAPHLIKVGTLSVWRHEVLHYLLKQNTGSTDSQHESPLFKLCT